jgi:hypothetical protein
MRLAALTALLAFAGTGLSARVPDKATPHEYVKPLLDLRDAVSLDDSAARACEVRCAHAC